MNAAIAEYTKAKRAQGLGVTPHRLVQMLMQSSIDRLATAKGCMQRNDIEGIHDNITTTMTIISTLRGSLDMEAGGEISINLDLLYGYMHTQLLKALGKHDVQIIDEMIALFKELLKGWEAMPDDIKKATDYSHIPRPE